MPRDKKKSKKSRISPSVTTTICAIVILIGGFFLSYSYVQSKKVMAYDYMSNIFYTSSNQNIIEDDGIAEKEETVETEVTNEYIGYLNIPKINLTKGFLSKNAPDNNVDKNLYTVPGSSYPDVESGNLILAGHSGTGWNAFFNDLYKLKKGDYAYITSKNKKYAYKIVNIYKQDKVGTIAIYRNYDKTTLTLVTCTNYESTTQTIYIAELQEITEA